MQAIELALEDLSLQEVPNYTETAKKFGVNRLMLSQQYRGKTVARDEYRKYKSLLNSKQTKVLINEINRLSALGTPATPAIVQVFVYNLAGVWPGVN